MILLVLDFKIMKKTIGIIFAILFLPIVFGISTLVLNESFMNGFVIGLVFDLLAGLALLCYYLFTIE
jgi:hypothetical protein